MSPELMAAAMHAWWAAVQWVTGKGTGEKATERGKEGRRGEAAMTPTS